MGSGEADVIFPTATYYPQVHPQVVENISPLLPLL
jgi:hypothetical protein